MLVRDRNGCVRSDSVRIDVGLIFNLKIGEHIHALEKGNLILPIMLLDEVNKGGITQLRLDLEYDKEAIEIVIQTLQKQLRETLLDGWNVVVASHSPGHLVLIYTAPLGVELLGSGVLLRMETVLFLSSSSLEGTVITPTLQALENNCIDFLAEPGHIQPEVCGLELRLIESSAAKFWLGQNNPNPAYEQSRINFSIGLDGPALLELFDVKGNRVGTLVDDYLEPGEYEVTWDGRNYPAGLYYVRLTSGSWVEVHRLILLK